MNLTQPELVVLRVIARGGTTKDAAHAMNVPVKIATRHRNNLNGKLGSYGVRGLIEALEIGLITTNDLPALPEGGDEI